jgi:hypothetical protein
VRDKEGKVKRFCVFKSHKKAAIEGFRMIETQIFNKKGGSDILVKAEPDYRK